MPEAWRIGRAEENMSNRASHVNVIATWSQVVRVNRMFVLLCLSYGVPYYILTPWCRVLLEQLTGFAASQEIPRISRNPKVHYRTHNRPPTVSILGQPNPVHIPTSHLLEIHPNIIHPSMPRSPQWYPSLRFPQQDPIHPLTSPIHATWPAHLILLDFITRTILDEAYNKYNNFKAAFKMFQWKLF